MGVKFGLDELAVEPSFSSRTYWYCEDLTPSAVVDEEEEALADRKQVPEEEANLVSSLLENGKHAPTLDIDIPHKLVPSTTPGHSHLYFDVELDWNQYVELLKVLNSCGIIEPGYYSNALKRGATFVRKPGVLKEEKKEKVGF